MSAFPFFLLVKPFFYIGLSGHNLYCSTSPGVLSTCGGKCAVTSCRACYYSVSVRPTPETDITCQTLPGTKCARQWVTQVRRYDSRTYDKVLFIVSYSDTTPPAEITYIHINILFHV